MTDRSAEELERDADRLRSGIARTSDELKHRMSPGQMVDEVTRYMRDSDGAVAFDTLRRQARDNPMALALIGTGIAWLVFGGGHRERSGGVYAHDHPASGSYLHGDSRFDGDVARPGTLGSTGGSTGGGPSMGERASGIAARAGETGRDASHRAGDMAQRAGEAGREATHRVSGFAESAAGSLRSAGHDARDRVSAAAHGATDRLGAMVDGAADRGRHMAHVSRDGLGHTGRSLMGAFEREPLVLGAIGLAVGAAIGAMLPGTRSEDEAFADARDRLASGAGRAIDRAALGAERAAEHAYTAGRDAAEREGLLPHEGGKPLAERVASVAEAAAGAATGEAEREAERAAGASGRDRPGTGEGAGSGAGTAGASPSAGIAPTGPATGGSTAGATAPGAGAGVAPGAASGMRQPPKVGTDDLGTRGADDRRDRGPGGTGPA